MQLNRNHYLSIIIGLLLLVWLLSGKIFSTSSSEKNETFIRTDLNTPIKVEVKQFKNSLIQNEIILSGKTAPNRMVTLKAESPGKIIALLKKEGDLVTAKEQIAQIDLRDFNAQLAKAQALFQQYQLEYNGALKLVKKGLLSETKLAEIKANVESAQAEIKRIQVKIEASTIVAPFAGILDSLAVELGDFLNEGDTIATILDFSPFVVEGDLAERQASDIKVGMEGTAHLLFGETFTGKIRYIQSQANAATRTLKIELEIPNQSASIKAGITSEIRIPLPATEAVFISPALLSLDGNGTLGVKVVDNNTVKFLPIKIIRADADGVWVSGISDQSHVIVVGGGFVEINAKVTPITK